MLKHKRQILSWGMLLAGGLCAAGPVHAGTVEVHPRAAVTTMYDDNITSAHEGRKDDFITSLLVGLGLTQEGKTHQVKVDGSITQQIFADHASFNNTAEDLQGRLRKEFSPADRLEITDRMSHAEEPTSFEDAFGRSTGRYSTIDNIFNAVFRHDLGKHLTWMLKYQHDLTNYSTDNHTDTWMNTFGTGVDYAIDSATILKAAYEYARRDFDQGPSTKVHELGLGVRRFFTSQLYLDVGTGADLIDSVTGGTDTKPFFRAALTNDIDENTTTGISFQQQYAATSYSQDVFKSWRLAVNLAKQLSNRIRGGLSAFAGQGRYSDSGQKEELQGAALGLSYDLTKQARLNLAYSYSRNDSSLSANTYTKNTVTLGVTWEF